MTTTTKEEDLLFLAEHLTAFSPPEKLRLAAKFLDRAVSPETSPHSIENLLKIGRKLAQQAIQDVDAITATIDKLSEFVGGCPCNACTAKRASEAKPEEVAP